MCVVSFTVIYLIAIVKSISIFVFVQSSRCFLYFLIAQLQFGWKKQLIQINNHFYYDFYWRCRNNKLFVRNASKSAKLCCVMVIILHWHCCCFNIQRFVKPSKKRKKKKQKIVWFFFLSALVVLVSWLSRNSSPQRMKIPIWYWYLFRFSCPMDYHHIVHVSIRFSIRFHCEFL